MKKVTIACSICKSHNYKKSKTLNLNRLIIKKYCPKCKKHLDHKEEK